jgi:hypothetical protein
MVHILSLHRYLYVMSTDSQKTATPLADQHTSPPQIDTTHQQHTESQDMDREDHSPSPISDKDLDDEGSPNPPPQNDGGGLTKTQSQASQFSKARVAIIMTSLCMALFLAALDVTIITTALPTIAQHFNAKAADYTWIGSAVCQSCSLHRNAQLTVTVSTSRRLIGSRLGQSQ